MTTALALSIVTLFLMAALPRRPTGWGHRHPSGSAGRAPAQGSGGHPALARDLPRHPATMKRRVLYRKCWERPVARAVAHEAAPRPPSARRDFATLSVRRWTKRRRRTESSRRRRLLPISRRPYN